MTVRAVQLSIDEQLLHSIDADPETRDTGRSAFVRSAVRFYLEAKRRQATNDAIRRAYEGKADELLSEIGDLIGDQAWPRK